MRQLTISEIDFVAGGTEYYGDEVVVKGVRPKEPIWTTPDPGTGTYNPGSAAGGSGWYYGPVDVANNPSLMSVDRSDLSPSPTIDLSKVTVEKVTYADGHSFNVITDLKTLPLGSDARSTAQQIMWYLNTAVPYMTAEAKQALYSLDNLVLADLPGRSFSEESKGTFYFDYTEIAKESGGYAASNILHDSLHIKIYDDTHNYSASRGTAAEIAGWQMQVDNAAAFKLTPNEVNYLNGLIANPASQAPRMNTPPY